MNLYIAQRYHYDGAKQTAENEKLMDAEDGNARQTVSSPAKQDLLIPVTKCRAQHRLAWRLARRNWKTCAKGKRMAALRSSRHAAVLSCKLRTEYCGHISRE